MNDPRALEIWREKYGIEIKDAGGGSEELDDKMRAILERFGLNESPDNPEVHPPDGQMGD